MPETHFAEKMQCGFIVRLRIDQQHSRTLGHHNVTETFEELGPHSHFVKNRVYPEPYEVSIFPGRMALGYGCAEQKTDYSVRLVAGLSDQAKLRIILEKV